METKPEFIEDDDKCEVKIITDICDVELHRPERKMRQTFYKK